MFLPDAEVHRALNAVCQGGPDREAGLSTTEPKLVGGVLTNVTEPDAADYARVPVPASSWAPAVDRRATAGPVVFADPVSDWGVIGWWFLTDGTGTPSLPQKVAAVNVQAGGAALSFTPVVEDLTGYIAR